MFCVFFAHTIVENLLLELKRNVNYNKNSHLRE